MLILSPQRRSAGETERERERESGTRLRKWDGHCTVCVCISTEKIRVTVWMTFSVFFLRFAFFPLPSKWYICVYRCAFLCAGGKCECIYVCLYAFVLFFHLLQELFSTLSLCFSSQSSVSLTFSLFHCSLSSPLTQVGNVITFRGCGEGKEGDHVGGGGALNRTWGRGRKKHLYVYPITTPASPKSPSKRTDAHALKIATSIPPPRCVCWLQWWWGRLNNVMAFLSSVSSGLITCVSSLCVIVAGCVNEFVCPLSDCTSWLSPSPADFNPDP